MTDAEFLQRVDTTYRLGGLADCLELLKNGGLGKLLAMCELSGNSGQLPNYEELRDHLRSIGISKFSDPSIQLAYHWLRSQSRTAQPISDEELRAEYARWVKEMQNQTIGGTWSTFLSGAKAAEKHHGISK